MERGAEPNLILVWMSLRLPRGAQGAYWAPTPRCCSGWQRRGASPSRLPSLVKENPRKRQSRVLLVGLPFPPVPSGRF